MRSTAHLRRRLFFKWIDECRKAAFWQGLLLGTWLAATVNICVLIIMAVTR